jgi:hypothetical protein
MIVPPVAPDLMGLVLKGANSKPSNKVRGIADLINAARISAGMAGNKAVGALEAAGIIKVKGKAVSAVVPVAGVCRLGKVIPIDLLSRHLRLHLASNEKRNPSPSSRKLR